jgi:hypothetical protein
MHTSGLAGHSVSDTHARQVFVFVLQIGLAATAQSGFPRHSTHAFVSVSQAGLGAAQSFFPVHSTQAFVLVSHAGFGDMQSFFPAHSTHAPETHARVAELTAAHSCPVSHALHTFVVLSQMGAAPVQLAVVHGWLSFETSGGPPSAIGKHRCHVVTDWTWLQ